MNIATTVAAIIFASVSAYAAVSAAAIGCVGTMLLHGVAQKGSRYPW